MQVKISFVWKIWLCKIVFVRRGRTNTHTHTQGKWWVLCVPAPTRCHSGQRSVPDQPAVTAGGGEREKHTENRQEKWWQTAVWTLGTTGLTVRDNIWIEMLLHRGHLKSTWNNCFSIILLLRFEVFQSEIRYWMTHFESRERFVDVSFYYCELFWA